MVALQALLKMLYSLLWTLKWVRENLKILETHIYKNQKNAKKKKRKIEKFNC